MKILIVCRSFAPDSIIGAKRLSMFAKYLSKNNFNVTVIRSGNIKGIPDESTLLKKDKNLKIISYLGQNSPAEKYEAGSFSLNNTRDHHYSSFKHFVSKNFPFIKTIRDFFTYYVDTCYDFYKSSSIIRKILINESFDIVLTTYSPLGTTLTGFYLKKYYNIKWIMDLRDLMDNIGRPPLARFINHYIQQYLVNYADAVTTPTHGFALDIKNLSNNKNKVHVLYNGFESLNANANKKMECLQLCYTGTIHDDECSLVPVFRALYELSIEKQIDLSHVKFIYAGKNSDRFLKMASEANMLDIVEDRGYVSFSNSLKIQSESDIFVIMVMNLSDYKGVLSGKLCESIQNKAYALGLVSGNIPNSELKLTIDNFNLGYCYESVLHDSCYAEMKNFLKRVYYDKLFLKKSNYQPKTECISEFQYNEQIKKLVKIIYEVTENDYRNM